MLNSLDGIMLKHDDKVSLVGDLLSNTGCKKKPPFFGSFSDSAFLGMGSLKGQ